MTNNQIHKRGIDQPDTPKSVTSGSIIFDSEENERPPWTITCCCVGRKYERSLLVLLLQYGIMLLVVTTSNLFLIFRHNEKQHWSKCRISNVPWLYHSITETTNKINSTDPHCFLRVIGPIGSRKTHLVAQLLRHHCQIFKPDFNNLSTSTTTTNPSTPAFLGTGKFSSTSRSPFVSS